MKKRIEIYLVMLLLLLSGFIVGCSKEDNILDNSLDNSSSSKSEYILGSKEIEVEDDFKNKPSGKDFYYGDIEKFDTQQEIELSDPYIPDDIIVYDAPEFEDAMEDSGFIDNNGVYGDLIIHSENRLDVLYEIYLWAINNIANDGFSRLSSSLEEAKNPDIPINHGVGIDTWANRLEESLQKLARYSILIHSNYEDMPDLIKKWDSFENKISNKVLILRNLHSEEDVKRYIESLEITECTSNAYNLAEEIMRILNSQDYMLERKLSQSNNLSAEEQREIEEYYAKIKEQQDLEKPLTSGDMLDNNNEDLSSENDTNKPSTLNNRPTTNGEGLEIE